jgi:hypothetical protein
MWRWTRVNIREAAQISSLISLPLLDLISTALLVVSITALGWLTDVFGGTDYGVLALVAFLVVSAVITTTLPNTEQK